MHGALIFRCLNKRVSKLKKRVSSWKRSIELKKEYRVEQNKCSLTQHSLLQLDTRFYNSILAFTTRYSILATRLKDTLLKKDLIIIKAQFTYRSMNPEKLIRLSMGVRRYFQQLKHILNLKKLLLAIKCMFIHKLFL